MVAALTVFPLITQKTLAFRIKEAQEINRLLYESGGI